MNKKYSILLWIIIFFGMAAGAVLAVYLDEGLNKQAIIVFALPLLIGVSAAALASQFVSKYKSIENRNGKAASYDERTVYMMQRYSMIMLYVSQFILAGTVLALKIMKIEFIPVDIALLGLFGFIVINGLGIIIVRSR